MHRHQQLCEIVNDESQNDNDNMSGVVNQIFLFQLKSLKIKFGRVENDFGVNRNTQLTVDFCYPTWITKGRLIKQLCFLWLPEREGGTVTDHISTKILLHILTIPKTKWSR